MSDLSTKDPILEVVVNFYEQKLIEIVFDLQEAARIVSDIADERDANDEAMSRIDALRRKVKGWVEYEKKR